MILYRKDFPLGKGVSFDSFIKSLEKETFPSFDFDIEGTASTENYRAKLIYIWSFGHSGWRSGSFFGGVLLSECEILHSKGERYFTLQASAKGINLFLSLSYAILAVMLIIVGVFSMVTFNTISFNNVAGLVIVLIVVLTPSMTVYFQDKKFLDKIGSLGMKLGEK